MKLLKKLIPVVLACIFILSSCTKPGGGENSASSNGGGGGNTNVPTTSVPETDEEIDGIWKDNEDVIINAGSSNTNPSNPQKPEDEHLQSGTLHKVNVTESNKPFVVRGKSDYKVIIPENAANEILIAANYFTKYVKLATGCQLAVEDGESYTWNENEKWIIFGRDDLFGAAGLTMPEDNIGISGYYIKTVGNSVFVAVKNNNGFKRAVLSLLKHTVGYEMYWEDTVVFEKNGTTIPDMDIIEAPDFAFYYESNSLAGDGRYGMGFDNGIFIPANGSTIHNTFKVLPKSQYQSTHPKWYSSSDQGVTSNETQICYTAHGDVAEFNAMAQEVARILLESAALMPNLSTITFTQEDIPSWCGCEACLAMQAQYGGSNAASMIKLINAIDDIVQAELQRQADATNTPKRELKILFFAYRLSEQPPVKQDSNGNYVAIDDTVICNPNVGVYIAPIRADYSDSFYTDINASARENIRGWGAICKNLYMWIYDTNFVAYMFPNNTWDAKIETYRFLIENNAYYVMSQSQYDNNAVSHFSRFKDYIDAKASFDVNVSFNDLASDFFANYFGPAAAPMRQFFDGVQSYMGYLEVKYPAVIYGGYKEKVEQAYLWPKGVVDSWLRLVDKAYASIEHLKTSDPERYEVYKEHILLESMFPRYVLLQFHRPSFNSEQFIQEALQFKADCAALGISEVNEEQSFTVRWEDWGI
ncbi:MAG: DUF4838 domain-containing protein [Clostridia bacterium]|nr:DUF4838 domain-containing protein [Clostridia bacterium]